MQRRLVAALIVGLFGPGSVVDSQPRRLFLADLYRLCMLALLRDSLRGEGDHQETPMNALDEYRDTLFAIRGILARAEIRGWTEVLDRWIAELESLAPGSEGLCQHLHRSWFATGGMGSLGDIVLRATASHERHHDLAELDSQLTALVHLLYKVTERLSREWGCPPLSRLTKPVIVLGP